MAFDGTTVAGIVYELNNILTEARISKIAQPENDELMISFKCTGRVNKKLLISANAGLPLVYFTQDSKQSPLTAPNFCMLLRKHLGGARVVGVRQFGLERVINIELEHLDELGDLRKKNLIVELMGKHSNIIFCEPSQDSGLVIIDSIKRISGLVSSVREVLPGRRYFIPNTMDKCDPYSFDTDIMKCITDKPMPVFKAVYTTLTGFSPAASIEICNRAGIDCDTYADSINADMRINLYNALDNFINDIKNNKFRPNIVYDNNTPVEFAVFELTGYRKLKNVEFDDISSMLERFYSDKNRYARIKQKSVDLRHIVNTSLSRVSKKLDVQEKQLKSTEKRDKYRLYGELLTTFGYSASKGDREITCTDYYTNEPVTIPLDTELSPIDNAKKYFDRYSKLKRTYEAMTRQTAETRTELEHLESINNSLEFANCEADLSAIKNELANAGYIRKADNGKKQRKAPQSRPLHYISSDGFDIYVGKNNYQNDELTFGMQGDGDWWFHSKGIAGSHVVLRSNGREITDRTFEEAASLAAHYSKGNGSGKVEIDYTELRNVKKPKGSKPGFVVYYTNYSMVAVDDISGLKEVEE